MRYISVIFPGVLALCGCYESRGGASDIGYDDPVAPDLPDGLDADAREDVTPDIPPEGRVDHGDEFLPRCRPQEAYEDPTITCDACDPCDAAPYMWTGAKCEFRPICCMCAGADCGNKFRTLGDCEAAYGDCPSEPQASRYPGARLLWQAPGGFAGIGPMLLMDERGLARIWRDDRGIYSLESPEWGRTDYDAAEDLGPAAANDLFDLLQSVDTSNLPHPPEGGGECYPTLEYRTCEGCKAVHLDYAQARDLLPEIWSVYNFIDERLCRTVPVAVLPRAYCEF